MTNRITQAYQQAPWRVQTQWLGIFLLALILIASVAGIYLDISSRAAKTGRDIQGLDIDVETKERHIADLRTELATLTSSAEIDKRLKALGFVADEPGKAVYIPIQGYQPRQPAIMAPAPNQDIVSHPLMEPRYTQSLLEWLLSSIVTATSGTTAQPDTSH